MKNLNFSLALLFFCAISFQKIQAQNVAINGTGAAPAASAMLDISSTTTGLLIPRMTTAQRGAIAAPATGLTVYDTTTGTFWYFNGVVWVEELTGTNGWMLAGNTLAGTEKLGSINGQPVRMYSNNVERLRFTTGANGEITLNQPGAFAYFAGDIFSTYATAANSAINGYASGTGIAGYFSSSSTGVALYGINSSTGWTVYAYANNAAAARPAVFGLSGNASGTAIVGLGNNLAGYSTLVAGSGGAFTGNAFGIYGFATTAASGTGGIFAGNNGAAASLVSGSGSSSQGTAVGAYNKATTLASGTGILAVGNNGAGATLATGSGGAFIGNADAIYASATTGGVGEAIYTTEFSAANVVRVNYWSGATQFKIAGVGTMPVSCSVKDNAGVYRTMYCAESPDFYFEDYGDGQLVNGQAHINIDTLLARYVIIDANHPLRVYIQIEGDENCKGVVVKNKTGNGFDVVEMGGGTSNATFQWHIICNVADADLGGRISHLADIRFQPMTGPKVIVQQPDAKVETTTSAVAPVPDKKPVPAQPTPQR